MEFGVVRDGERLQIRFRDPSSPSGFQEISLNEWSHHGEVADALAKYVWAWGAAKAPGTRRSLVKTIEIFRQYLRSREEDGHEQIKHIPQISAAVLDGYAVWLEKQQPKGGVGWSNATKALRYNCAYRFCEWLAGGRSPPSTLPEIGPRRCLWSRDGKNTTSYRFLSEQELLAVRDACRKEVAKVLADLEFGESVVADPSVSLPSPGESSQIPYRDLKVCIKSFDVYFSEGVPKRSELRTLHPGLSRTLVKEYNSAENIARHLYFTSRTIVPFVLLLTIDAMYNPATVLSLSWEDIQKGHPIFGDARWRLSGRKGRANERQFRSFAASSSDPMTTVNLLRALEKHTARIRSNLPIIHRNRVFCFWQARGQQFRVFGAAHDPSEDSGWCRQLKTFITDHELRDFSLASLRKGSAELVDAFTAGDIKAQQRVLGHASATTTDRHYRSPFAKRRRTERLATGMQWHERYVTSDGKADTRDHRLFEGRNTAATPGFVCIQPHSSPQLGQREGRMCSAYGKCPDCPLAMVNPRDPFAYKRLTQLRDAINLARTRVEPARWFAEWKRHLIAIEGVWLPLFGQTAIERSALLSLPSIPPVE
ncbi:hypothetical protein [Oricola nitratireducens]|uniref:hypothetical protein n=1 Tax=Oricola nitratireducens TaxID=2775868 RepID=UPI001865EE15|nr:hypothetical protein [Oricola nitratireducens]